MLLYAFIDLFLQLNYYYITTKNTSDIKITSIDFKFEEL